MPIDADTIEFIGALSFVIVNVSTAEATVDIPAPPSKVMVLLLVMVCAVQVSPSILNSLIALVPGARP